MAGRRDDDRRRVYGRRKGHRLRSRQMQLVDELLPKLRVPIADGATGDPKQLFPGRIDAVWLEIGFGGGEHMFARARANSNRGLIGCEPFLNGVAKLLSLVQEAGLVNVRVHDDDARLLLEALPDACIERVFILYPDPWPKTRHHKRRFINPENLDQLARIMTPGGELQFASDIAEYVRWTLMHMRRHPAFEWQAGRPEDWRRAPADWPGTRYEAKALEAGRVPAYLSFCRVF
jgi:tRNA (guanine-N7-)-methyltransferase